MCDVEAAVVVHTVGLLPSLWVTCVEFLAPDVDPSPAFAVVSKPMDETMLSL